MTSTISTCWSGSQSISNTEMTQVFWENRELLRRTVINNLDRRLGRRVDSSDILQDAYIEASKRLPKYLATRPMGMLDWLRVVARNIARNANVFHLQTRKRSLKTEAADVENFGVVANHSTPSHTVIKRELLERRNACVRRLTFDEQEVLHLRHDLNRTNGEVARILGISEKAASKRYYRAIKNLTELMNLSHH